MNTAFLLAARFESPTVELRQICHEFFGINAKTAEQHAKAQKLPVTTFKLRDSEKSPTMVKIEDLAAFIDARHAQAKRDWDAIQQARG
ncbi:pyocin activator PrtN family protein [Shewanella sp.]|uniref:pyocin activator PrtN family protein n=1 Tax=Shewanella sp. TaxID=50422 RepID=UPI003A979C6D